MTVRAILISLLLCPTFASASLMTFDAANFAPTGQTSVYIEDGITAVGQLSRVDPGTVHLGRVGPWASNAYFTMSGHDFIAESIDIRPWGSDYCANGEYGHCDDPIPYIWVSAFLDDLLVGSLGIYRPYGEQFETFSLSFLGTMDLLLIEARNFMDLGLPGMCAPSCGHFDIDNLRLNPVSAPEPETLALLALGVIGAALSRKRRQTGRL